MVTCQRHPRRRIRRFNKVFFNFTASDRESRMPHVSLSPCPLPALAGVQLRETSEVAVCEGRLSLRVCNSPLQSSGQGQSASAWHCSPPHHRQQLQLAASLPTSPSRQEQQRGGVLSWSWFSPSFLWVPSSYAETCRGLGRAPQQTAASSPSHSPWQQKMNGETFRLCGFR